ncbi:MAG: DNA-directed RNA polymerase subunit omega [Clostridia bacterium]|nr:DNA-directed RNA polymerase subunit omega [Clostridia bacterium]
MLAKPSVDEVMPKVGTRYELAIAVAKRARQIAERRIEEGDPDITDAVDIATREIAEDKVKVEKEATDVVVNQDIIVEDEEDIVE